MAFAQFDDGYADHRKVAGLSDAAFRLHTAGILYCSRHLSDGFIETVEVPRLVRRYRRTALVELLDAGLWRDQAGLGYVVHDYLQWNPSREVVLDRKEKAAKRKADYMARRNAGGDA